MIKKLLIANRGEVAMRIIRTAKEMGIQTVAVYADQDIDAQYVRIADSAYALNGNGPNETYRNGARIIEIACRVGADAIHPGYGYLSEDAAFARAVREAGIIWVGPAAEVISSLGDKIAARCVAKAAKVQPIPGISEAICDGEQIVEFAKQWGYPVLVKRSDGGGGRGITRIDEDRVARQFTNEQLVPGVSFFVEKLLARPRHVETQCVRDLAGNFTVISTRDCTVQRRNQKVIEEAPAPFLTSKQEEILRTWSAQIFAHVNYVGVGTCEFLIEKDEIFFLEVNPRLQVEHTVSEEVTGIDLVREQLQIAEGKNATPAPKVCGHSIELRITTEDPEKNLAPGSGTIESIVWPGGRGIRIESAVVPGDYVAAEFDSMIAKIIITASTRKEAILRAQNAVSELAIEGIPTPASLLKEILSDQAWCGSELKVWTRWLENEKLPKEEGITHTLELAADGDAVTQLKREKHVIELDGRRVELVLPKNMFNSGTQPLPRQPIRNLNKRTVGATCDIERGDGTIGAPIQSIVIRASVSPGQTVEEGDLLVVIEAMKMEKYIRAPRKAKISEVLVKPGQNISAGAPVVRLAKEDADATNNV